MRSNIKLGKVSGIEIGLHYSWFIIAALIVFSLVERFREVHANWSGGEIWSLALVTAAFFFVTSWARRRRATTNPNSIP